MFNTKRMLAGSLAALTMGTALIATAPAAEARGLRGGALAAGVFGGLALGALAVEAAQPRRVYVVERRKARKHNCGCVHVYQ